MRKKYGRMLLGLVVFASQWVSAHEITPQRMKQLKSIFSKAVKFTEEHIKLTESQVANIQMASRVKITSSYRNIAIYKADSSGKTLGYVAFFQAQEPDGNSVPAAVGVLMDGTIAKAVVFSHHAGNPLAQESFLKQFTDKKVTDPQAWHPDHTVMLVTGKETESLNVIKAIRITAAVIVAAKGLK